MRFLSYIRELLSGRIYYKNKLIFSNMVKIYKNVEKKPESDFVRIWTTLSVSSIGVLFERLLFGENSLKAINIRKLDEIKMFEAFQLIGVCLVDLFLMRKSALAVLRQEGLDEHKFRNEILSIFNLSGNDWVSSGGYVLSFGLLYHMIVHKILGKASDAPKDNKNIIVDVSPAIRRFLERTVDDTPADWANFMACMMVMYNSFKEELDRRGW